MTREEIAEQVAKKLGENFERVCAMVVDHGEHWDLAEKDEVAIKAILGALIDAEVRLAEREDKSSRKIANLESLVDSAEERVKELREALPRWIPVEERLPEIGKEVIAGAFIEAHYADGRVTRGWQATLMVWTGEKWLDADSGDQDAASHWMPLPSAPGARAVLSEANS